MTEVIIIILAIVAVAVVGAGGWYWRNQRKDTRVRDRFGEDEYNRVRAREGSRGDATAELERRERRVDKYDIRPLSRNQFEQLSVHWRAVQSSFVDSPASAVHEADTLITEVMTARGYPMEDFGSASRRPFCRPP